MKDKALRWYVLSATFLLCLVIMPYALSKYHTTLSKEIVIETTEPEYYVAFDPNAPADVTVTGSMSNQHFVYGTAQNLSVNNFTASDGFIFTGWNTEADGSGDFYTDQQLVENLSSIDGDIVTLYAQWSDVIAEIDGVYYNTLQAAVLAVPTNNTPTTIRLLTNTSESITVAAGKNITFDLQNYTISNNGSTQVIVNNGTINISNGTIISSADYAAIDNNPGGRVVMSGGQIIATGTRQAIYNNKGYVEISGTAYLSSAASGKPTTTVMDRGTIQNLSDSTLVISGGTIVGLNNQAISNQGTMTIGTEDGNVNVNTPVFIGATYGIKSSTDFNFYDGIMKGKTAPIDDVSKITGKETGYNIVNGVETIEGQQYKTGYLAISKIVTFDPNGGTVGETTRGVEVGKAIGELPKPTRAGYKFDGWFTESTGGTQITENEIITDDVTYYAHWTETNAAEVNGKTYKTLASAINSVPTDGTETVIKIINDTSENVTVKAGQNIVFDIEGCTLSNTNTNAVITNNGTVTITNGTVTTDSPKTSAINNNSGARLYVNGGRIVATGDRQAIYNDKGYVEISGDSYLSSAITASGDRGTVQNQAGSTMVITGGTIVSTTSHALYNQGTLTIGTQDGNIDATTPSFTGKTYGIKSTTNFNYYDGIFKGQTSAIENEAKVANKEAGSSIAHGTETIDEVEYKTAFLQ